MQHVRRHRANWCLRIGWLLLIGGGLWKLLDEPGESSWVHWTDPRLIALLLAGLALVLVGVIKKRRREDKYRARFL